MLLSTFIQFKSLYYIFPHYFLLTLYSCLFHAPSIHPILRRSFLHTPWNSFPIFPLFCFVLFCFVFAFSRSFHPFNTSIFLPLHSFQHFFFSLTLRYDTLFSFFFFPRFFHPFYPSTFFSLYSFDLFFFLSH